MIKPVDAWQCSDGSCYANKQSAYTAQINLLYQEMPNVGTRQPTAIQFGKIVKEVSEWLRKAEFVARQMKDEGDVETARSIAGQGG